MVSVSRCAPRVGVVSNRVGPFSVTGLGPFPPLHTFLSLCYSPSMPIASMTRDEAKANIRNQNILLSIIRKARYPELYIGFTEDMVNAAQQATPEIKARFEEVFDRDQRENLRIILHPFFKRWSIVERTWHKGQPLYQLVTMFHGTPKEDHLPPDLYSFWGRAAEHLRGRIGEFRNVEYQDLEFIEKCDFRKYGWEAVDSFLAQWDEEKHREEQRVLDDRIEDFLDYNFWLAMRDAQAHYSQPWSTRSVDLRSDPSRYHIERKDGYTVRTRIWGEEGDVNEMKALVSGELEDYWDSNSASGRAAARILEIKNSNYMAKHGVTLWEAATGKKPEESDYAAVGDDSIAKDKVNKDQVTQMRETLKGTPLPEERVKLEDWLLETIREKVLV